MAYTKLSSLLVVLFSAKYGSTAMIRAPTPAVTPAPAATAVALAARDVTTLGYISTGMYGSRTLCKIDYLHCCSTVAKKSQMTPSLRITRVMSSQHQVAFTRSVPQNLFASSFLVRAITLCTRPHHLSGTFWLLVTWILFTDMTSQWRLKPHLQLLGTGNRYQ